MGIGIRPVTPGTIVVLVATILLTLVSVSTPLIKSIYFLDARVTVSSVTEDVKLGVLGYCIGTICSNATVGYKIDVDSLFGVTGLAASTGIPSTLIHWLTYVLILHPVAAGFALLATICGLLAHIREFKISGFATCFASIGSFIAVIAFAFDLALFIIAKKRLESSTVGGKATLGNGLWMTLAGALLLMFSGCFFGLGRCLIRNRQPGREASEKNKPQPDAAYGQQLRNDALSYKNNATYGQGPIYQNNNTRSGREGALPEFAEYNGEIIPLTALPHDHDEYRDRDDDRDDADTASLVTGVGKGYGRRTSGGVPISFAGQSEARSTTPAGRAGFGAGSAAAAGGAGAYLAAEARQGRGYGGSSSTVAPFQGMEDPPANSQPYAQPATSAYYGEPTAGPSAYQGYAQQPYASHTSPPPQQTFDRQMSPPRQSYDQRTSPPPQSPPYSGPVGGALPFSSSGYPAEKGQIGQNAYASPPPGGPINESHVYSSSDYYSQQPVPASSQQQFYAQNPSEVQYQPTGSTYPSTDAPSYYPPSAEGHQDVGTSHLHDSAQPGQLYNPYEHRLDEQRY